MDQTAKQIRLQQLIEQSGSNDADRAVHLARWLLTRSRELQTDEERNEQGEMDRLVRHPEDKATLVEMTDQAFRAHDPARIADQMSHVLHERGIPQNFGPLDRAMLATFRALGPMLPSITVPLVLNKMRQEAEGKVLHAEAAWIRNYLLKRHREGVRINLNFLGEAVLSESEAARRMDHYLEALALPEVECISVKISTIYSQNSMLACDHTTQILGERLHRLLFVAHHTMYRHLDDRATPKFVYLDMEEYRDMHLTVAALKNVLDRPDMMQVAAGLALQAYLPDAAEVLEELTRWSVDRRNAGGAPLTIRLVKGANMEMERVEAAIEGWPQAPFETKLQTDSNWKRMLRRLLQPELVGAIRVGVASHNLFDIALALVWSHSQGALDRVQFEMLEGMADHQRRALSELSDDLLLYAPACRDEEFVNAIGYLIRRLDENTMPENFLRHAFVLQPSGVAWQQLEAAFRNSLSASELISSSPRRTQDRSAPSALINVPPVADHWSRYVNEANTDWSLVQNVRWWKTVREDWQNRVDRHATELALFVGDDSASYSHQWAESFDPSRPGVVVCRYQTATAEDLRRAVELAKEDRSRWRQQSVYERHDLLRAAAVRMRERRGDLLGAAAACGGKTVLEADPEVSEAIDFAEFYPLTAADIYQRRDISVQPRGVVVVVSPWNFPIAIPCGGVAAALAAGNSVILKPASHTVLTAAIICQCFWDAGIPRDALQLMPCDGELAGQHLIANHDVDSVILTGGTETAERMFAIRPSLELWAETGGKNAMIVTRLADRDLAIRHVLQSAFGHAGQKCSATSLLLLERGVYNDPGFRRSLVEAAESLVVGSAWEPSTRIGPLIRPPKDLLLRGLMSLDPDESWALAAKQIGENRNLWSPGIKWNVSPGSFMHRTELFGPVLAVMAFDDLEAAIELVHSTGYGLTSGLQSLDDREQKFWSTRIQAGNLYVNRPTTGAIVLRQPFGGFGKSQFGSGIKAGGPHYVIPLMQICDTGRPMDNDLSIVGESYQSIARNEFMQQHDDVKLLGQDNLRRYLPVNRLAIRVLASDRPYDVARVLLAAKSVKVEDVYLSLSPYCAPSLVVELQNIAEQAGGYEVEMEPTEQLVQWIADGQLDRVRYLSNKDCEGEVLAACHQHYVSVVNCPVTSDGRIELLRHIREQSLSCDYHRYGNLGRRAGELRKR